MVVNGKIDLSTVLAETETIDDGAPIFVALTEEDGSVTGEIVTATVSGDGKSLVVSSDYNDKTTLVDYYIIKPANHAMELQIDAENFAGYYYVEASTLFRDQATGRDLPAEITLPNVKIQSNFTFSMAATGDPSTFTFTMDAFPGYTYFNKTKKVLCVMQVIDDSAVAMRDIESVMKHPGDGESI